MEAGELDSQTGARVCNGLGIMRACLSTSRCRDEGATGGEIREPHFSRSEHHDYRQQAG
jgi:hypothetical protein